MCKGLRVRAFLREYLLFQHSLLVSPRVKYQTSVAWVRLLSDLSLSKDPNKLVMLFVRVKAGWSDGLGCELGLMT